MAGGTGFQVVDAGNHGHPAHATGRREVAILKLIRFRR